MRALHDDNLYEYEEEFRDSIATVDTSGKRIWVYPKKPSGHFHRWRIAVSVIFLVALFAGPFIRMNGQPFMLFNIFERRFIILGQVFWPQDFFLFALTLIIFFVFIILFTVAFGRLWCGWACPQTLFMEMVFRKIEYWIEGDANNQRKLDQMPWTPTKIFKKFSKQIIFFSIALVIAHLVMAYLIGIEEVKKIVTESPSLNLAGFIGLLFFTILFYSVFAWFREQACVMVCPYGRLQSVLLVKDSIVVAYDWLRGEPRGKLKKNPQPNDKIQGDCIDCKLCVHVCPTGIDIRNGTQLECVNCTACIDVCDEVMVKIHKPKGLIRYSSYNAIKTGVQKLITPRVVGYSFVLVALLCIEGYFIFTRSDIQTTILKAPGTLYSKTEDGKISNLYSIEFVNKTFKDMPLDVRIESPQTASLTKIGVGSLLIPKGENRSVFFLVKIDEQKIDEVKTVIELGIYSNGKRISKAKAKFIGPLKARNSN